MANSMLRYAVEPRREFNPQQIYDGLHHRHRNQRSKPENFGQQLETLTDALFMNHTHRKRKLALTLSLAFAAFATFGFTRPPALSEQSQRGKVWRPTRIPAGVNFTGSQACAE